MYKYETHCHTSPVSRCGKASVKDTVCFYKEYGYDGIFITNQFLDGNINPEARKLPYRRQIDYYFSDYEEAVMIGSAMGIKVFPGVELSYKGTDFLIYGLDKAWYKAHPEIMDMEKSEELPRLCHAPQGSAYGCSRSRRYPCTRLLRPQNRLGNRPPPRRASAFPSHSR